MKPATSSTTSTAGVVDGSSFETEHTARRRGLDREASLKFNVGDSLAGSGDDAEEGWFERQA